MMLFDDDDDDDDDVEDFNGITNNAPLIMVIMHYKYMLSSVDSTIDRQWQCYLLKMTVFTIHSPIMSKMLSSVDSNTSYATFSR